MRTQKEDCLEREETRLQDNDQNTAKLSISESKACTCTYTVYVHIT